MTIDLPAFQTTEEAMAAGRNLSRDQFLQLAGAREELQKAIRYVADSGNGYAGLNIQAHLAFRVQLIRECLEEAPFPTLVSLLNGASSTHQPV